MEFASLHLAAPILKALQEESYHTATPIQSQAIPIVLKGHDLLGIAQTGTGKTAAFALPLLHLLQGEHTRKHQPQILVLAPTRELAIQIHDGFRTYGRHLSFRSVVVVGGANLNQQAHQIKQGVDIVIATPGRLIDLMQQRLVDLSHITKLVLDEADRMLDMGFIQPIRQICAKLPAQRQTLMFSATMPREIRELAEQLLKQPREVNIAPAQPTADRIEQAVYFVDKVSKPALFAHLFETLPMARVIVFTRTKHGADRLVRQLRGFDIHAEAIHGNKSQNHRQRSLNSFKSGKTPVLIATDIAARGIDVDLISHVVNFDLTHEPETYVHRIGRTARAGEDGMAVSFCSDDELENLRYIEKLIKREIPSRDDHPYHASHVAAARAKRHGGPRGAVAGQRPQPHERPRAPMPKPRVEHDAPQLHAHPRHAHPLQGQRDSTHRDTPRGETSRGETSRREQPQREYRERERDPRDRDPRERDSGHSAGSSRAHSSHASHAPSGKKPHRKGSSQGKSSQWGSLQGGSSHGGSSHGGASHGSRPGAGKHRFSGKFRGGGKKH